MALRIVLVMARLSRSSPKFVRRVARSHSLWMVALWILMLALELVNSAVEEVVDCASPEWNELAKHTKDY